MTITIKLTTDNAAFEDDPDELKRILQRLADSCEDNCPAFSKLFDVNGNCVGTVEVWD